jgi:hypothetical protein
MLIADVNIAVCWSRAISDHCSGNVKFRLRCHMT